MEKGASGWERVGVDSPTFCSIIDTLVITSTSLVLLLVGGRCKLDAIGSEMWEIFIFKTLHVLYHHMVSRA